MISSYTNKNKGRAKHSKHTNCITKISICLGSIGYSDLCDLLLFCVTNYVWKVRNSKFDSNLAFDFFYVFGDITIPTTTFQISIIGWHWCRRWCRIVLRLRCNVDRGLLVCVHFSFFSRIGLKKKIKKKICYTETRIFKWFHAKNVLPLLVWK